MLVPKIISAPRSARDSARESSLEEIKLALEEYYADHLSYPDSGSANNGWICLSPSNSVYDDLIDDRYISTMPTDPFPGGNNDVLGCTDGSFRYISIQKNSINDNAFILAAEMENEARANIGWTDLFVITDSTDIKAASQAIQSATTINGEPAYAVTGG